MFFPGEHVIFLGKVIHSNFSGKVISSEEKGLPRVFDSVILPFGSFIERQVFAF